MRLNAGDRVRVVRVDNPYTGCRGTIAPDSGAEGQESPLGYFVAIDGENGVTRPFLAADLEPLTAVRVRAGGARRVAAADRAHSA